MEIKDQLIQRALTAFDIKGVVSDIEYFIDYVSFDNTPSEVKVIAKVDFQTRNPLVVRITKEKHIDNNLAETQSVFASKLRLYGVNTPLKYSINNKFVIEITYEDHVLNVSIEDYVGPSIQKLNLDKMFKIGKLLGGMHKVSQENSLRLETGGYVFNFLGKNEVVRLDRLLELLNNFKYKSNLIEKIRLRYDEIIDEVRELLSTNDKLGVQGDINASNLSIVDNDLWVFDFNIACDEYLVIQFVIEGLLLSYEEEYEDDSTYDERFESFCKGYLSERKLLEEERKSFPLILKVSKALWFTKIHIKENSIESLLKESKFFKVEQELKDIYKQLT